MKIVAPPTSPVLELTYMLLKKPVTSGSWERTPAVGEVITRTIGSNSALSVIAELLRCGLTDRPSSAAYRYSGHKHHSTLTAPRRQLQGLVRWLACAT